MRELSAPPSANCIVLILASCLGQFPFFRQPFPSQKTGCFNLPPRHPSCATAFPGKMGSRLYAGFGVPLPKLGSLAFQGLLLRSTPLDHVSSTVEGPQKTKQMGPRWCGSVDWVPTCKPKGCWLDSQSGHMSGLSARSPVRAAQEANIHWCFSPLSPSLTFFKK